MSPTRALIDNSKSRVAKGAGISHCFDGFYLGAPQTAQQTVKHEHRWRDSYAGYGDVEFFMYAKSVKLKLASDGGYYFKGTAANPALVETTAGGGWRSV